MTIANKFNFANYYNWLFEILFEFEEGSIDMKKLSDRDIFQQRAFAYISEIFFWVWIKKNNLKVKEIDILHLERKYSRKSKLLNYLKRLIPYYIRVAVKRYFKKIKFFLMGLQGF